MDVIYRRCCGIDVHKEVIAACFMTGPEERATKSFGTTTNELRELVSWLKTEECGMAAMESTGPYWKPLYNVFELEGLPAMVVNAAHMRNIPGYKTDKRDAKWIASLLRHGLLRGSFIPDKDQREYRELTRFRASRIEERARDINRLQKMLEGANIKLSGFVSDIMGKTAQKLIKLVIAEESPNDEQIAGACHGNIQAAIDELKESLTGIVSPLQRELFAEVLRIIEEQTHQIQRIEALIRKYTTEAYDAAAKAIDVLPGIGRTSAEQIIAEIGIDMSRFPTANNLCAWAGLVPGDNESAGKRKNSKTRKGNKTLKKTLIQCAVSAVKNKNSYFHAQYQR
jgi:transposase